MGKSQGRHGRRAFCAARRYVLALLILAGFATSPHVLAQTATTTGGSEAVILTPLSIVKVRDLDFGGVLPSAAPGVITMSPITSTCGSAGGARHFGDCQPAVFAGSGVRAQIVRVKLQQTSILLNGPGVAMLLDNFSIDGSPSFTYVGPGQGFVRYRISSNTGVFNFRVGGQLHVGANQVPGTYVGSFEVRVDYQ